MINLISITSLAVRPDPIRDLSVTDHNATSITITWNVSTVIPIDSFEISYNYTVRGCMETGTVTIDSDSNISRSHILSGLQENTDYAITLRAKNGQGMRIINTTATTNTSGIVIQCMCRCHHRQNLLLKCVIGVIY